MLPCLPSNRRAAPCPSAGFLLGCHPGGKESVGSRHHDRKDLEAGSANTLLAMVLTTTSTFTSTFVQPAGPSAAHGQSGVGPGSLPTVALIPPCPFPDYGLEGGGSTQTSYQLPRQDPWRFLPSVPATLDTRALGDANLGKVTPSRDPEPVSIVTAPGPTEREARLLVDRLAGMHERAPSCGLCSCVLVPVPEWASRFGIG